MHGPHRERFHIRITFPRCHMVGKTTMHVSCAGLQQSPAHTQPLALGQLEAPKNTRLSPHALSTCVQHVSLHSIETDHSHNKPREALKSAGLTHSFIPSSAYTRALDLSNPDRQPTEPVLLGLGQRQAHTRPRGVSGFARQPTHPAGQ